MKIGITGAGGLIGFHVRAFLASTKEATPILAGREIFSDPAAMERFLSSVDGVLHLAGMTHGPDDEVYDANTGMAERLVDGLKRVARPISITYASTLASSRDTAYGRSKREAGNTLLRYGAETGVPVAVIVIPNVFGEFARPFHNTVIATFCDQLINGAESRVDKGVSVRLLHAFDVARILITHVMQRTSGTFHLEEGDLVSVEWLYEILQRFQKEYSGAEIPCFENGLERRLFNVFRSHLPPSFYPQLFTLRSDARGSLYETVRASTGGQVFVSTTKPGHTRGEHWHTRKFERFCVLVGSAEVRTRRLFDDTVHTYHLSGDTPAFIDTPTFVVHNLVNTGTEDLITLFWASEAFNPEDPDTIQELV